MKQDREYYKGVHLDQKTPVQKYTIRNDRNWMASIVIDDSTGQIWIQSDYGNYAYAWTSRGAGVSLRQFLVQCNPEYIADKFSYGSDRHFFAEETLEAIREQLLQRRRERELTKKQARDAWDEIKDSDVGDTKTPSEFHFAFSAQCPETTELLFDEYPFELPFRMGFHPQLTAFMERTWPHFVDILKKELADEKVVATLPESL